MDFSYSNKPELGRMKSPGTLLFGDLSFESQLKSRLNSPPQCSGSPFPAWGRAKALAWLWVLPDMTLACLCLFPLHLPIPPVHKSELPSARLAIATVKRTHRESYLASPVLETEDWPSCLELQTTPSHPTVLVPCPPFFLSVLCLWNSDMGLWCVLLWSHGWLFLLWRLAFCVCVPRSKWKQYYLMAPGLKSQLDYLSVFTISLSAALVPGTQGWPVSPSFLIWSRGDNTSSFGSCKD